MPRSNTIRAVNSLDRGGTLTDRIYSDLRTRLQRSAIGPNERLVDVDLASAYGTSRMPAREALLRLVNDGYLVGTTRGFAVPTLTADDVLDIFEVRRLLEPAAAASVATRFDADALAELDAALAVARRAASRRDADGMILANIVFRKAWLARVRNRRLAGAIDRFVDQVQTVRLKTLDDPDTCRIDIEGLEQLRDAFASRHAARVRSRMSAFIAAAQRAFVAVQKEQEARRA